MVVVWDSENAAHLLRRAGFSATSDQVKKALKDGHSKAVKKLFVADKKSDKHKDFESFRDLQFWWIQRMVTTKSPLIEKLTLFWHNHFATANSKISNYGLMHGQNRTLRKYGLKDFRDLILEISRDPAMIIWLDNKTNYKDNPNENYARELMELFTTGVLDKDGLPNYTEEDVVESARAFTGWTIDGDKKFFFNESKHDFDSKTFRGVTGNLDGGDIVENLVLDSATARRISQKLWSFFAYPVELDDAIVDELEQVYLNNDTAIKPVLEHMFKHDEFFSATAKNVRVKSPAELIVNMVKLMKAQINSKQGYRFGDMVQDLGQSIFDPPTVFGWKEGLPWVGATGMLERLRAADDLTQGRTKDDIVKFAPAKILGKKKQYKKYDAAEVVAVVLARFGLSDLPSASVDALVAYMLADNNGNPVAEFKVDSETIDKKVRGLCAIAMSLPEFQRH